MPAKWSEETIAQRLREGRGQGTGPGYKPWLTVHDFSSRGRCHRIWSEKFGRTFQLFSDVEKAVFLILERSRQVGTVEEQSPIDRDLSQKIAKQLGIRHPTYPRTNVPVVLTVDFLTGLNRLGGRTKVGVDAKTKEQAEDPRVIEKLELSRACLAHCGYDHLVIFDSQLSKERIHNLEWIRSARKHEKEIVPHPNYVTESTERFRAHLSTLRFGDKPLRVACDEFDVMTGYAAGTALRAARLLIDAHLLQVELDRERLQELPLHAFSLAQEQMPELALGVA